MAISEQAVPSIVGGSGARTSVRSPGQLDLTIVLVNWNGLRLTSEALASIERFTKDIRYEVFVVDNGTTEDESVVELPRRFPWIHFIANPDNRGYSKANNQGIRRAKGRYILLLNNDTIQIENALGRAVSYMDGHPGVGALGITHLNRDEEQSFQASFFAFPKPWSEVRALLAPFEDRAVSGVDFSREQESDWVVGSFLLIRRACYEDVGELDERFFVYDEDIDWCFRAKALGWKVVYWPGARMIHVGAASRPFIKDKTFVHFRSHLSYIRKNPRLLRRWATTARWARASRSRPEGNWLSLPPDAQTSAVRERVFRQRQFALATLRPRECDIEAPGFLRRVWKPPMEMSCRPAIERSLQVDGCGDQRVPLGAPALRAAVPLSPSSAGHQRDRDRLRAGLENPHVRTAALDLTG